MSGFYLNQFALNYLAQLILTASLTVYLLNLRGKSRATWLFTLFFVSMTFYAGTGLVATSSVWSRYFYAIHLQLVMVCVALLPLLQFAYCFPAEPQPGVGRIPRWEPRLGLAATSLALLWAVGWVAYQSFLFVQDGSGGTNTTVTSALIAVGFTWVPLVFWRRAAAFSRFEAPHRPFWGHWLRPIGKPAQAAFDLMLVFVVAMLVSVFMFSWDSLAPINSFLTKLLPLAGPLSDLLPSAGVLLDLFLIAAVYFNVAPERTSLLVRLVGVALTFMLLILGLIAELITPVYLEKVTPQWAGLPPRTLRFEPLPTGGYAVSTLPLQFVEERGQPQESGYHLLPFVFPFWGERWEGVRVQDRFYLSPNDTAGRKYLYNRLSEINVWFSTGFETQTWINPEAERYVVTWESVAVPPTIAQAVLYPDGRFDLNYRQIGADPIRRVGIQSGNWGDNVTPIDLAAAYDHFPITGDAFFVDVRMNPQQALHPYLAPLAWLIVLSSIALLILLPVFYHRILVEPLRALERGARAVDQGHFQTQIPVQAQDELGYLTQVFNQMVASIYKLDQHLEEQVATRTQQLADSEARYHELFDTLTRSVFVWKAVAEGADFQLLEMNRAAEKIEGLERETALGQRVTALAHQLEWPEVLTFLQNLWNSPLPLRPTPVRYQKADGQWREVSAYKLPTGELVMLCEDLTERLAAESQKEKLATLEERERIGRELHDNLGQVLGYVNTQSQAALAQLEQGQAAQTRAALAQLARVAQTAHTDVRQYILGIRTTHVTPLNFFAELDEYLSSLRALYSFNVQLSLPEDWVASPFAPEVETQLLRILQEALTNCRKHAHPAEARVRFTLQAGQAEVMIEDNGPGFDLDQVEPNTHFGLGIMRERAAGVGGSVAIDSRPNSPTRVVVRMPCALPTALTSPTGVRVLIADDHLLYLEGLSNLLATRGVQVVGKAHDGLEAQELARTLLPDLILMDVQMPNCDGLEATRRIKAERPEIKVVMLTMSASGETLFGALKAGASGYLLKNMEGEQFFRELQQVLVGQMALSPELAQRLLEEFPSTDSAPVVDLTADILPSAEALMGLTTRQREVLHLIVAEKSNKEIAVELFVSENTVKFHVREILNRLRLRSRHELTHYLRQVNLPSV